MKIILAFYLVLTVFYSSAEAYPTFIGFGYRSCMVCHESGAGGGSLTDYGRAVFASEIAANPFSKRMSDEDMANISNFLGPVEFPWWMRMGIKYRAMTLQISPGSAQSQKYYYNMQDDLNLNFYLTRNHSVSLISTVGYIENINALAPNSTMKDHLFMREYYAKIQWAKEWWTYTGFMDKTFGIRTPNHAAVNRSPLDLGQNDQVHSIMLQKSSPNSDFFIQYWLGNLHRPKTEQLTGGSLMWERKVSTQGAIGFDLLSESKKDYQKTLIAIHGKAGMGDGNAVIAELGNKKSTISAEPYQSIYLLNENTLQLVRGYFITSGLEATKDLEGPTKNLDLRWNLGLLAFPINRLEFRASVQNRKILESETSEKDQWALQTQIHLSL